MSTASPNTKTPIAATKPAAGYIGGKRNLAGRIVPMIDGTDHDGYAEPFVGMGGIFLRRRLRPRAEFINDISGDVVNFFRIVREHYTVLMDHMRWLMASRAEFQRQQALPAEHLTDIQRATRFLYLQRLAFGGKVRGRNYGVDSHGTARFNVLRLERDLAELHDRLCGVVIEQLPYADFIRRYDRAGMLFYLDPPYWGCEDDYGFEVYSRDDFARLAAQLGSIRGKFVLSLNDTPGVRECFAAFSIASEQTTYTIGGAAPKRVGEVIISNYPIRQRS